MEKESQILRQKVQHLSVNLSSFNELAIEIFHFQKKYNPSYAQFLELSGQSDINPSYYREIPCIPISLFKTHDVRTGNWEPTLYFSSSGTTGTQASSHPVHYPDYYLNHTANLFEQEYGPIHEWTILALLPGYLERTGSSLVLMADYFIKHAQNESGFFLHQYEELFRLLNKLKSHRKKTLLLGVTHALLDFSEQFSIEFPSLTVMETGGMKGRRKEMIRSEVHELLCKSFGVTFIHSEYGMTELFSQAYSSGNGIFKMPASMKVAIRDVTDPISLTTGTKSGAINIYDLANVDTISFIATDDLGKLHNEEHFEVLGRIDHCDIRGCNLMVS